MALDIELIKKCYNHFNENKTKYENMYDFYKGKSEKMSKYSNVDYQESHKANFNFYKKMVKEEVSYGVGNPINYVCKTDESVVKDIEYHLYHWDRQHDSKALKHMVITSIVYELYYISDVDLSFNAIILNPTNGYAYCDNFGKILFFLHVYKLQFDKRIYIDVYTDKEVYHFNESWEEVRKPDTHIFGRVPVNIGELSEEKEDDTLYSDLKDIQDALSIITSDGVNEITNMRQAILVGCGMTMDKETAQKLKEFRYADLPTEKAKLEWLIKNLNPEYQALMMDKLEEYIYKLSFHVNSQEKMQSNLSSLALRTRLINLEMKVKLNNLALTNLILGRIKFLFIYLGIKENKQYDWRTISIKYNSVIPSDDLMIAQIINQLGDKLSDKTGLQQLSFVDNADMEIEQRNKERESDMLSLEDIDTENNPVSTNTNGDENE